MFPGAWVSKTKSPHPSVEGAYFIRLRRRYRVVGQDYQGKPVEGEWVREYVWLMPRTVWLGYLRLMRDLEAKQGRAPSTMQRVLGFMQLAGRSLTASLIGTSLDLPVESVKSALSELKERGLIERVAFPFVARMEFAFPVERLPSESLKRLTEVGFIHGEVEVAEEGEEEREDTPTVGYKMDTPFGAVTVRITRRAPTYYPPFRAPPRWPPHVAPSFPPHPVATIMREGQYVVKHVVKPEFLVPYLMGTPLPAEAYEAGPHFLPERLTAGLIDYPRDYLPPRAPYLPPIPMPPPPAVPAPRRYGPERPFETEFDRFLRESFGMSYEEYLRQPENVRRFIDAEFERWKRGET